MNNGMTTRVCVPSKEDDCPTHFTLHLVLDAWESVIFIFLFLFLKDLYIILAIIYRVFLLVSFFFPVQDSLCSAISFGKTHSHAIF